MEFKETTSASFHLVRRGECWVISEDRTECLGPGDLVFVEPGRDHVLASHSPDRDAPAGEVRTLLLCGYCSFRDDIDTPLMRVFPTLSIVREEELIQHSWLKSTLDQLSAEYLSQRPGAELIVNKLTEIVLVELIRIDFARNEQGPFVAALTDKYISKALHLLHNNPQTAWTLDSMAAEVGLSRAAFAKRFKQLVAQPMFAYLTALRIQRAKELLHETQLPLYEIASRVGYESDLAFTRTFKKHTGTTPVRYRKQSP